jgi:hypothetical protein
MMAPPCQQEGAPDIMNKHLPYRRGDAIDSSGAGSYTQLQCSVAAQLGVKAAPLHVRLHLQLAMLCCGVPHGPEALSMQLAAEAPTCCSVSIGSSQSSSQSGC